MSRKFKIIATFAFAASLMCPYAAVAQPSGGTVVVGGATISAPSSTSTIINQTTSAAIINWQSFSLATGSSVLFNQPSSAAITLNRVLGAGTSQIYGSLQANGQVWIINSNGILFGKGSQINVAGLLATTSDIADSDFTAGRYNFNSPSANSSASIDNAGTIHVANGGSAVLSGNHIGNQGLIQADAGKIVLGGANAFTVDFDGDNLLRYEISAPVSQTPTDANGAVRPEIVSNSGTLTASGGTILMTARAAANVADNVVNNSGMISATSASVQNGEVILDAGDGTVADSGTIDASGNGPGQTGGNVTLAGNTVNVADNARIDASGDQGGGTVAIGGGLHGGGAYAPAQNTTVGAATIRADADTSGNGGTISIWSAGTTTFSGAASARGGAASGNGGMVETSGQILNVLPSATVDTMAPNGSTGDWLLDPKNLTVVSSVAFENTLLINGVISYGAAPATDGFIAASTIETALLGGNSFPGTNVTLQAVDDITVQAGAAINGSGTGRTLELDAGRSIILYDNINMSGGTLILSADNPNANRRDIDSASISGPGVISADVIDLILGSGGAGIGSSGAPIQIGAGIVSITSHGANAYIQATNAVTGLKLGSSNLGAGSLFATSPGDLTFTAGTTVAGSVTAVASSNLTIASGATITSSASGDAVVLSSGHGFTNNSGGAAVSVGAGGRFLIYSAAPTGDTFGGLDSHNTAIWNTTYPTAISAAGSRYVFAFQPTLTFTSLDQAKTYGQGLEAMDASAFSVSGLQAGVSGAYLGDDPSAAFSGSPVLSSPGWDNTATVAGGPYPIAIDVSGLTSSAGYAFTSAGSGKLTVNPADLFITANDQNKTYGTTFTFNGTEFVANGLLNTDSISSVSLSSLGAVGTAGVGDYDINASSAVGTGLSNYTISYAPGTMTVNPAGLLITADSKVMTYGGAMPALTASYTGFVNGDTSDSLTTAPTIVSGTLPNANADTYVNTLTASGAVDPNYTITYAPGTLTISQAALLITADNKAMTYGGAMPALTASYLGFVNGDTATSLTTAPTVVSGTAASANAGTYVGTLTASGAVDSNYAITYAAGTLTINQAALLITADSKFMTYGGALPALTASYAGFVNGDTTSSLTTAPTVGSGTAASANAGTYVGTLTASGAVDANYAITYAAGTLTINQAALTVTANNQVKTYDGLSYSGGNGVIFSGLVNSDTSAALGGTLTYGGNSQGATNAGGYAITPGGLTSTNYAITFASGTLTINPATLTYVADAGAIPFGSAIPPLTGTVTGFVNEESLATATKGTLLFTTSATSFSPPGSYAINGSGLTALNGNYVFVQDPGNATALTISSVSVEGLPPEFGFYLPWFFGQGGQRPTDEDSLLYDFTTADGEGGDFLLPGDSGGSNFPSADGATSSGPIATLTFDGNGYLEPPTSADRLSGSLSHYFGNGSLFDGNYSSWGNEALWY